MYIILYMIAVGKCSVEQVYIVIQKKHFEMYCVIGASASSSLHRESTLIL